MLSSGMQAVPVRVEPLSPSEGDQAAPNAFLASLAEFTPWQPLQGSWLKNRLPDAPGLYRIRQQGAAQPHYVGQTGSGSMTLPKRMGMLRGVYADEMPYRDPHTVGPALWADRHQTDLDYEVSVLSTPDLSTPERKGLEALVLALHRQEHGASPLRNFGRMPLGYRMSSANNAALARRGLRVRGGMSAELDVSHQSGVAPTGPLIGDVHGFIWLGLEWTSWLPITDALTAAGSSCGLYRIRRGDDHRLTYIGEGRVSDRLTAHLVKGGTSDHRQREYFCSPGTLEASFVVTDSLATHQRLELETDLIGSHLLVTGEVPRAQFLG